MDEPGSLKAAGPGRKALVRFSQPTGRRDAATRRARTISLALPERYSAMTSSHKGSGRRTRLPTQEIRQRMNLRLEELYRRHLPLHDDEIVGYYDTGLGYSKPER